MSEDTGNVLADPPRPASAPPPKGSLGGEFRKLWVATGSSAIGDGVALVAAPLMASTLTGDPRLIAGVTTALTLPYAVLGLPVGVLVDRLDRRRTMAWIDLIRGCALLAFTVLVALGHCTLPVLYGCFFLVGSFETFFRNAAQAIAPVIVDRELLVEANARLGATETTAIEFLGPLAGTALFVLTPSIPFGIDAASFFVSAVLLTRLRVHTSPAVRTGADGAPAPIMSGLVKDIGVGVRWLWRHRLLLNLNVLSGLANLVLSGAASVLVVYTHRVLGIGSVGYGLLLACGATGAVAASRLSPPLVRKVGREWALVTVAMIQLLSFVAMWLSDSRWVAGAALLISGYGTVTFNIVVVTLRQTLIPDELQGRVNSMYRLVAWGSIPVGASLAGQISFSLGPPRVYALGAVVMLLMALWLINKARTRWITTALDAATAADPA